MHFVYENKDESIIFEFVASISCLANSLLQKEPLFDLSDDTALIAWLIYNQGTNGSMQGNKLFFLHEDIFEQIIYENQVSKYLLVSIY